GLHRACPQRPAIMPKSVSKDNCLEKAAASLPVRLVPRPGRLGRYTLSTAPRLRRCSLALVPKRAALLELRPAGHLQSAESRRAVDGARLGSVPPSEDRQICPLLACSVLREGKGFRAKYRVA